jgi:RHS repeat-associated protein
MVVTAPAAPSLLAGPSAPGRSASRIASDRRGATRVSPEKAVFEHLDRAGGTCIGRTPPHRRDSHRGRRRFSGHTRDGRYSWARYYHPGLQRFISEDLIQFSGGDANLYAYVANSPLNWSDALGLSKDKYVPDSKKHGANRPGVGPHVDRYGPGGKNVGRYRLDGTPIPHKGKVPPPIPGSDSSKFLEAVNPNPKIVQAAKRSSIDA